MLNAAVRPDARIPQGRARPDHRARRHRCLAVQVAVRLDHDVCLQPHVAVHVDRPRVAEAHARRLEASNELLPHEPLRQRQRLAVHEPQARLVSRLHRRRGAPVRLGPLNQPCREALAPRVLLHEPGGLHAHPHIVPILAGEVGSPRPCLLAPFHHGQHGGRIQQGRVAPDEQGRLASPQGVKQFARSGQKRVRAGKGFLPLSPLVSHDHHGRRVEPPGGVDHVLRSRRSRHAVQRRRDVRHHGLAVLPGKHDHAQPVAHRAQSAARRWARAVRPASGTGLRSWGSESSLIGVFGGVRGPC